MARWFYQWFFDKKEAKMPFDDGVPKNLGPVVSQQQARTIMGRNVFGTKEATKYFGVKPTRAQLVALAKVPFTEASLRKHKDSHILVAVLPLSIIELRDETCRFNDGYSMIIGSSGYGPLGDVDAYHKEAFVYDCGETAWYLVRRVGQKEKKYCARVLIYAIIGHFLATGERLLRDGLALCSDATGTDCQVHVGLFNYEGLRIRLLPKCEDEEDKEDNKRRRAHEAEMWAIAQAIQGMSNSLGGGFWP